MAVGHNAVRVAWLGKQCETQFWGGQVRPVFVFHSISLPLPDCSSRMLLYSAVNFGQTSAAATMLGADARNAGEPATALHWLRKVVRGKNDACTRFFLAVLFATEGACMGTARACVEQELQKFYSIFPPRSLLYTAAVCIKAWLYTT